MVDLGQLFGSDLVSGKKSFYVFFAHDTMFWYHLMFQYVQLSGHAIPPGNAFRKNSARKDHNCRGTGSRGFEPPTTWLKARRSAELSYEPSVTDL